MSRARAVPFAVAFTLVASVLSASGGYILTDPEPGQDIPSVCDGSSYLTPSDGGSLFFLRSEAVGDSDPAEDDILWSMHNATSVGPGPSSCDWQGDTGFGNWNCFNHFTLPPLAGQTKWGVITVYPGATPGTVHEGWILIDNGPAVDDGSVRPMSPQRLRVPVATPGGIDFGAQRVEGVVIEFEYPTEWSGHNPDVNFCHLGGDTDQTGFDGRVIGGYNLYRLPLTLIDPVVSRPEHYLCGPDLDCSTTGDNGWVAYIPLDPRMAGCGVDDVPCQSSLPLLWPYEVQDLADTPNADVRYVDQPPDPGAEYAWVVQPVLRVNDIRNLTDWHGMKARDLDGDGMPEFVDPSRNGLGLTANGLAPPSGNGGGATPDLPIILVTSEATTVVRPCDPLVFDSALAVSQGSGCDMVVSWDPALGGMGRIRYDLYRHTSSPVPLDPAYLVAADLTATSHTDPVAWGTDYVYRVVARDGCLDPGPQEAPNGGGDSVPARIAPLSFDSAITVVDPGFGTCWLDLSWDPAMGGGGAIVYDVYRDTSSPVPLDPAHLVASGLSAGTHLEWVEWGPEYSYRVVARDACTDPGPQSLPNGGGDSAPQAPSDMTPPTFAGISHVRDSTTPCRVVVHWDEGTASDWCAGIDHYVIYRDPDVAQAGDTAVGTSVHSPYGDASPGNGVWVYVVRAVDRAGNEEQNEVYIEESENSCSILRDARLTSAGNVERPGGDGSLRIDWEPSPDEGGPEPVSYTVLRGPLLDLQTAGYTYLMVDPAACDITDHFYLMAGQVDGVAYYYVIAPVSGTRATFGYDSRAVERPAAPVCP